MPSADGEKLPAFQQLIADKYRVDELYDAIVSKPLLAASGLIHRILELNFFDRLVNGAGQIVVLGSRTFRFLQTGNVGFYVFAMTLGILALLAANLFLN